MQHRTARGSFDAAEPLAADKVPFDWRLFRLHGDHLACTVGTQLRGILALDGGDARGEFTGVGHPHVIPDDVRALVQTVEEGVGLVVLGLEVELGAVLAAVA